ncbi:hypothetical protein QTJ16_006642 [Diplocarpon rosae]|uniref:Transcription factor tau subunit sfc1 n=1 Tax=Diplocarpon rosae TaxID=946125 RepID=A0AAD9SST2_9HELO|nr:hypothetical protein QTJ16_006642 [Diplocarpon rosae]
MPILNRGGYRRPTTAPVFQIPSREITAVEHPMIIRNLENGIKTFGRNRPFTRILDSVDAEECVPLYLRYNDPMCVPLLSHNAPTNNVLLKITVPKRTGRKRKRGSQDPFTADGNVAASTLATETDSDIQADIPQPPTLNSVSGMDDPTKLLRKLKDNVGEYRVEAVGEIRQTHRYRSMSDFHQSTAHTEFIPMFEDTMLTGQVEKMRKFKLNPSRGWKPNEELLPPPVMSSHNLPFNWGWHQAPQVEKAVDKHGKQVYINRSKPDRGGVQYLAWDVEDVPTGPNKELPDDDDLHALIAKLREALEERPIWTRRSLANRVGGAAGLYMFKQALPHVGYQFRGGPWRDALIKFGLDPRKHPKYREYQTFFFQFIAEDDKIQGAPWQDSRQSYHNISKSRGIKYTDEESHVFDGKRLTLDGKVWQVCDIKVPILANLMKDAPYRTVCEPETDGFYCNGTIAKFKAIMKTVLISIKAQRPIPDEAFAAALEVEDHHEGKISKQVQVPVPDLGLTNNDLEEMRAKGILNTAEADGIIKWALSKRGHKRRQERIRVHTTGMPGARPKYARVQGPKMTRIPRKQRLAKVDKVQNRGSQQLAQVDLSSFTDSVGIGIVTSKPGGQLSGTDEEEDGLEDDTADHDGNPELDVCAGVGDEGDEDEHRRPQEDNIVLRGPDDGDDDDYIESEDGDSRRDELADSSEEEELDD